MWQCSLVIVNIDNYTSYVHIMLYKEQNEPIKLHTLTRMNFTNMILNERSQTQKSTYYKILFTLYVKTDKMDLLCLKKNNDYLLWWRWLGQKEGSSRGLVMFCFMIWVLTQCVDFMQINQIVHLWPVHFLYEYYASIKTSKAKTCKKANYPLTDE